jgi:hypothetical protein
MLIALNRLVEAVEEDAAEEVRVAAVAAAHGTTEHAGAARQRGSQLTNGAACSARVGVRSAENRWPVPSVLT